MKTKDLFSIAAAGLLFLSGCASDEATKTNERSTEGMTAFVVSDAQPKSRTTADYDGTGLDFYWTAGDRLWVNNTAATPALIQDARNDINDKLTASPIAGGVQRAAKAKFWFEGSYTAASYPLRYTGKGNTQSDKVTIKASQTQTIPNDASHIGEDGDCGVATATKPAGVAQYHFTLNHTAAYATFLPYNAEGEISGAKITKIKITADQAIAGTFDFDDSGIKLASRPTATPANQSIELTLGTAGTGFGFKQTADIAKNAATMVVAPGTYATLKVEYTLYDADTHVTGTVTRNYSNVTFTAGLNKKVSGDLGISVYENKYYLWDAQHDAWYGYYQYQPTYDGAPAGEHYPQSEAADPDRWYNTADNPTMPTHASNSCKDCPNLNQMIWYCVKGNPHWDGQKPWSVLGHLYVGGMWFKKAQKIADDEGTNLTAMQTGFPDPNTGVMTDWRTKKSDDFPIFQIVENPSENHSGFFKPAAPISALSSTADYFYLPAFGAFFSRIAADGTTEAPFTPQWGAYWSSTRVPASVSNASGMYFTKNQVYAQPNGYAAGAYYTNSNLFK